MRAIAASIVAASLSSAPAIAQDAAGLEILASEAFRQFAEDYAGQCTGAEPGAALERPAERWNLAWDSASLGGPRTATLYKFYCEGGSRDVRHVWYLQRPSAVPAPIRFTTPDYEPVYGGGGARVTYGVLQGYAGAYRLENSRFDPETMTVTATSYWSGDEIASTGIWRFIDGQFVLRRYEVDRAPNRDGEPLVIVDND